jgi:hypothetical protein
MEIQVMVFWVVTLFSVNVSEVRVATTLHGVTTHKTTI